MKLTQLLLRLIVYESVAILDLLRRLLDRIGYGLTLP